MGKLTLRSLSLAWAVLVPCVSPFRTSVIKSPSWPKSCRSLSMVGFGRSTENTRKSKGRGRTGIEEEHQPEKAPPVASGDLPEDAFFQFPPLSPREKDTLRRAGDVPTDEGSTFPTEEQVLSEGSVSKTDTVAPDGSPSPLLLLQFEVTERIRERHGFKLFDPDIFSGIRLLYADPVVFEVEDFFTPAECEAYIAMSTKSLPKRQGGLKPKEVRSATTSSQSQYQQHRTSTTWFHHFSSTPELVAKASVLLGINDRRLWEEPQTVRYRPGERFSWHLDALPPTETGASRGGQRTATVLVYLTDLKEDAGGSTAFRDLGPLRVRPKKGKCLVFFPSFGGQAGSPFDGRTLHAGEVVAKSTKATDKYIAQLWCHKRPYPAALPEGNSHEAAEKFIEEYMVRWRGK